MSLLEQPHIVAIYDSGEHSGLPYIVMKYMRGGHLTARRIAAGGRFSPEAVSSWLPQIATALDYVHAKGHFHRDVKPENILFSDQEDAALADFGIAAQIEGACDPGASSGRELTLPGHFVGSPSYAPPEAFDRALTPQYDQYSLGVVVYEALSGKLPFDQAPGEQMRAKTLRDPIPLYSRLPGVIPAIASAVMRAISRQPENRYSSCGNFAHAFLHAATGRDR